MFIIYYFLNKSKFIAYLSQDQKNVDYTMVLTTVTEICSKYLLRTQVKHVHHKFLLSDSSKIVKMNNGYFRNGNINHLFDQYYSALLICRVGKIHRKLCKPIAQSFSQNQILCKYNILYSQKYFCTTFVHEKGNNVIS